MNVDQLNALYVIFTGQYPLDTVPGENEFREAQRAIAALRESDVIFGIHNSLTLLWEFLPYRIDTNFWLSYLSVLNRRFIHPTGE